MVSYMSLTGVTYFCYEYWISPPKSPCVIKRITLSEPLLTLSNMLSFSPQSGNNGNLRIITSAGKPKSLLFSRRVTMN